MSTNDRVLSEFIDDWNAGRRPRVRDYLARLPDGPQRDELADTITDWLSVAPTPSYSEDARRAIRAEPVVARVLDSPLAGLRERAGFSVRELAARVARTFALSDVDRTAGYLARLEAGELDPARVSRRLLDAVGALLGGSVADSAALSRALRPAAAGGALFRAQDAGDSVRFDIEVLSRAALSPAPPPMDELDRLFTGGPDA